MARSKSNDNSGGLVYIESPVDCRIPTFSVQIRGAVEAPRFILGETDPAVWRNTTRNLPAPWGELETSKCIITLPAASLKQVEDPVDLVKFWDTVMDRFADLAGRPSERHRAERYVPDVQISAGYMHSGYPLMTGMDMSDVFVNKQQIISNAHGGVWGLFHEMGHNHQNADWTFDGTVEVTEIKTFKEYQQLSNSERPKSDDQKRDQWMVRFSQTIGKNLGPFFQAWGVPTSQTARDSIMTLPQWLPENFPPKSEAN